MDHPRPSVFAEATPADGGARGRDSLFLLADLYVGGASRPIQARVRNLSAGGLMAELPEPVAPEATVEVEVRGLGRVPGRIAWQVDGRAGVAFDREVDPQRARKPIGAKPADNVRRLRPSL